jgi:uncharacterized protein (DUF1499 family)
LSSTRFSLAASVLALFITACASTPPPPGATPEARRAELSCTLPSNCVDSLGGSFTPLRFEGDAVQAVAALKAALASFHEAKVVRAEGLEIDTIFTTPMGFRDAVDFRIDPAGQRIDYRSRSLFGLFDFGKNRSRMREFIARYEQRRVR